MSEWMEVEQDPFARVRFFSGGYEACDTRSWDYPLVSGIGDTVEQALADLANKRAQYDAWEATQ